MLNLMIAIGRLGSDPTMRYTPNGHAVTSFSVATNRSYTNGDGEKKAETEWINVVAWRQLAEICNQYLAKGRLVAVVGRLQTRTWEDDAGVKHSRTEVVAQTVRILDKKPGNGTGEGEPESVEEAEDVDLPM
jgi:single-strand DNA-binding protein